MNNISAITNPMLAGIPEESLCRCTAPLSAELLAESESKKNQFYIINHTQSKLKGGNLLSYMSTLKVHHDIDFDYPLPYAEYEKIMVAYFTQLSITSPATLHVMAAMILLAAKGMELEHIPYEFPVNGQFVYDFIATNNDLVQRHLHFIDSTQVYALSSIPILNDHYKPKERFENIDDANYVSANIVMMYRMPEFVQLYFAIDADKPRMSYFVKQYEDAMFNGSKMGQYFRNRNNLTSHMFEHLALGTFQSSDVCDGVFRNGVFDPTGEHYEPNAFDATAPKVD